ncbi:12262_t:CDS:2 [Gigaspora margarita]|uniref:12262_t:CDS:1 n=1 Tax=Gigaspora margarita TaxID=4874 RepID=A0ABN7UK92_GIGMA|nr:12262_t:CDS:2 [Gigaspora margarita]
MEFAIPDDALADAMDIRRSKRIPDDAPAGAMDNRKSKRQKTDQRFPQASRQYKHIHLKLFALLNDTANLNTSIQDNNNLENLTTLSEIEIVNVLGAADELCLNLLVEALQGVLIERKHLWLDKQSVLIYNAGQKYPTCTLLSEIMQEALYQEPEILLKSDDLTWRHIPAAEFEKQVSIFKRLLPPELHDPDISGSSLFYTSPTYSTVASRIQSVLINPDQAARIASWIDRLDITPLENGDKLYKSWHIPYQFKLVLRGSRDQTFLQHTLTSNQALVIIKPSNSTDSTEILGGYNPLSWSKKSTSSDKEPQNTSPLKDCFVFSLGSDEKNDILSRVIDPKDSVYCNNYCSPVFGKGDLFPKGHFEIGQPCGCKQISYEKPLRQSADQFTIEEFEVFQVIKKEY